MRVSLIAALLVIALLVQLAGCVHAWRTAPRVATHEEDPTVEPGTFRLDYADTSRWTRWGAVATPVGVVLATAAGLLSLLPA